MPISADSHVQLTDAAEPLRRRAHGRYASDEAVAAGRIGDYLDDHDLESASIRVLMRECGLTPQSLAGLIREKAILVLDRCGGPGGCERCGGPATSALCDDCREFLGGARMAGRPVPPPPPRVSSSSPAARTGARGMLSRRRPR